MNGSCLPACYMPADAVRHASSAAAARDSHTLILTMHPCGLISDMIICNRAVCRFGCGKSWGLAGCKWRCLRVLVVPGLCALLASVYPPHLFLTCGGWHPQPGGALTLPGAEPSCLAACAACLATLPTCRRCLRLHLGIDVPRLCRGEPWGDFSMTIDRAPRRIDSTGDFVDVSCGAFHNLALNSAGECFTWGINDFGGW